MHLGFDFRHNLKSMLFYGLFCSAAGLGYSYFRQYPTEKRLQTVLLFFLVGIFSEYTWHLYYKYKENRVYRKFEKTLNPPVIAKAEGLFEMPDDELYFGVLYFTEQGLVIASKDKDPIEVMRLKYSEISEFIFDYDLYIHIRREDGYIITLGTDDVEEVRKILREKGIVF